MQSDAEHYKGLANYIKVIAEKSPLVVIDGGKRVKYILEASPADLSSEQIIAFAESFITGTGHEYKIDEEVVYSDNAKVEEEL